jgi:hypothetical protein
VLVRSSLTISKMAEMMGAHLVTRSKEIIVKGYFLHLALIVFIGPMQGVCAADESKTAPPKKARNPSGTVAKSKPTADDSRIRYGVGAGMQSFYLPVTGFELIFGFKNFMLSPEYGMVQFSQAEFSGRVSFIGLDGRWTLDPAKPLFFGLATGLRTVDVTTSSDLEYVDSDTGNSGVTKVAWHRHVSQMILFPRVGWIWPTAENRKVRGVKSGDEETRVVSHVKGGALSIALGLIIPFGSRAQISGNPTSAAGVGEDEYQHHAGEKLKDVTSKTNGITPGIEVKYLYFFP